jgi:hypothetical protein
MRISAFCSASWSGLHRLRLLRMRRNCLTRQTSLTQTRSASPRHPATFRCTARSARPRPAVRRSLTSPTSFFALPTATVTGVATVTESVTRRREQRGPSSTPIRTLKDSTTYVWVATDAYQSSPSAASGPSIPFQGTTTGPPNHRGHPAKSFGKKLYESCSG